MYQSTLLLISGEKTGMMVSTLHVSIETKDSKVNFHLLDA